MSIKIGKKIKGYAVVKPEDKAAKTAPNSTAETVVPELPTAEVIQMHERIERPDVLIGSTYKIKSPLFEHALYVTINDIVLNAGTDFEARRPYEIFINSKNMDHFQWIVALTRIMSAVFRKGGDVTFVVEEMKAVFDPRGGYFKAGGLYMPSIVAEIGVAVEEHLKSIGMIHDPEMSAEAKKLVAEKRAAYEAAQKKNRRADAVAELEPEPSTVLSNDLAGEGFESSRREPEAFPPAATLCAKCHTKAVIIMDGCATCLNCGNSKCG